MAIFPRCVALAVALVAVFLTVAPARAAAFPDVTGHWRCTGGPDVERSYVSLDGHYYGRGDDNDGAGALESIAAQPKNGRYRAELPEGYGDGALDDAGALVVTLHDSKINASMVTMSVHDDVLTREVVTADGNETERCMREAAPVAVKCAEPYRSPRTLYAARPVLAAMNEYDATVDVVVVLDDRSEILWTQVFKHSDPAEDDAAVEATLQSRYQTEVRNCVPQAGEYIFLVTFRMR